ncbi:MAG: biotin--[acetyl-CoA-carboxylase] ligase [Parerythrobacter sp.]
MIEVVAETGSTNADLLARLRANEAVKEGAWLLADRQTQGRGRGGRSWIGEEGNLFASTMVKLRTDDPPAQTLSFVTSLALHAVIDNLRTQPFALQLKWPNDVLVAGAKLSGILLERARDAVVVGIGVNIRTAPALNDRKTTSLRAHGMEIERDTLAQSLAATFARELKHWRTSPPSATFDRWQAHAHPVGSTLSVHDSNGSPRTGIYQGLSDEGALLLRLADGTVAAITAGDVSLG